MINHIGKYNDAQAIQDALDAGTLANPYVAMTSAGTIDYNTLSPTPPAPSTMGTWTYEDVGEIGRPNYILHITETGTSYWDTEIYVGQLDDVYFEGRQVNMSVYLIYTSFWTFNFVASGASDVPSVTIQYGDNEVEGVSTSDGGSEGGVLVTWMEEQPYDFYFSAVEPRLYMTTHDPEYPAGE